MGYEARGKIHVVFETKHVSDRFSKREFVLVIEDNPKYPQLVQFQATGDRCSQLDGLHEGDEVEIEFSLRGREWRSPSGEVKYFNTLDVWKVVPTRIADAPPPSVPSSRAVTADAGSFASGPGDPNDDIPFAHCDVAFEPSPIARLLR